MNYPPFIIVKSVDGEYMRCKFVEEKENADEQFVPIYEEAGYFHYYQLMECLDECVGRDKSTKMERPRETS